MGDENLFSDQKNGVRACFVISAEQKEGIKEVFPCFPQDRVIVAPNGINMDVFKPSTKKLTQVLEEQMIDQPILWPSKPTQAKLKNYTACITFVGKAAEWKRQAALLYAAQEYEAQFSQVATLCVGTGPAEELKKITDLCKELNLKNTFD